MEQTLEEILAIRRDAVTLRSNLAIRSGKQSRWKQLGGWGEQSSD
jgi:hypothetical protein